MANIYGQACRVIVWLREAVEKNGQALQALHNAGGHRPKVCPSQELIQRSTTAFLQPLWLQRI